MIKVHRWVVTVAAAISFLSSNAYALELGKITWQSSFGQPLRAKIDLADLNGLSASDIRVALASAADFSNAGIERIGLLSDLNFKPVVNGNTGYVQITSSKPISEPYINFLINAAWNSNTVSKEYTILMDISNDIAKPSSASSASKPNKEVKANVSGSTTTNSSAQRYKVARGDSLWSIAEKFRGTATANQAALAIFQQNPKAFLGKNANQLLAGYNLQIPADAEMKGIAIADSISFINETKGIKKTENKTGTNATKPSGVKQPANTGSTVDPKSAEKVKELQQGVNETVKKIDEATEETNKLAQNLDAIQDEIERLKQIADAKDEQVKTMKELLEKAEAEPKKPETTTSTVGVSQQPIQPGTPTAPSVAEKPPAATPPAVSPNPSVAQSTPKPPVRQHIEARAPVVEESWVDYILGIVTGVVGLVVDNIIYVGGAVGAIVLAVVMLKLRRRRSEAAGAIEVDLNHVSLDDDAVEDTLENDAVVKETVDSPLANLPEELDILDKVDIYLAYSRFDEAKALLADALVDDPMNTDYRLKLMEVYGEQKDKAKFLAEADELALINPLAKDKVDELLAKYSELSADGESKPSVDIGKKPEAAADDFGFSTFSFDKQPPLEQAQEKETTEEQEEVSQEFNFSMDDFNMDHSSEEIASDVIESAKELTEDEAIDPQAVGSNYYDEQKDKGFHLETIASDAPRMAPIFSGGDSEESLMSNNQDSPVFDFVHDEPEEEPVVEDFKFDLGFTSDESKATGSFDQATHEVDWPFQGGETDILSDSADLNDYSDLDDIVMDQDQITTKLELVKAYIDMGDHEGAHDLIEEVLREGNDEQKAKAKQLLGSIEGTVVEDIAQDSISPVLAKAEDDPFDDLDFDLPSGDEVATKLALAKAYISMGDKDAARDMLEEILKEGDEKQRQAAQEFLSSLD